MSSQVVEVQVQGDFIERLTSARPIQALAELVWNALDADATKVIVDVKQGALGLEEISVTDNGDGILFTEAATLFGNLGGSWKRLSHQSKSKKRILHGEEGKGRFRALALGRVVEWIVTTPLADGLQRFTISILRDNPRRVIISDSVKASVGAGKGISVVITEPQKQWRLDHDAVLQEFAEIFALYLTDYPDVEITFCGTKVDPSAQITSKNVYDLEPLEDEGELVPARIELIEWRTATERMLYLCNEQGFPLHRISPGIQAPGHDFSAYLKSPYIGKLNDRGVLGLAELDSKLNELIERAKVSMRAHFRARDIEQAKNLVAEWKSEQTYPYQGEPQDSVQKLERQVFEIVALNVATSLPDFQSTDRTSRKFQLRILRQAIEKSPAELQLILNEVLGLPKRKQDELAKLLRRTPLSAIISAAKMVGDRLDFLDGLDTILFDQDWKARLKERSQLHRILADNTWLFGEEFALTVDDQSLTEVLRKHAKLKKLEMTIDEPVKRLDETKGIVDLMLSRSIPGPRAEELDHLIIELKAPKVKIGSDETTQIQSYAFAVMADERFRDLNTRWTFWIVSNDMDDFARQQVRSANRPEGMLWQSQDSRHTIWARTWSQILTDARARLRVFQKELNYSADRDSSVEFLKESYARILSGESEQADAGDPDELSEENIIKLEIDSASLVSAT